jgi:hypothetical protein
VYGPAAGALSDLLAATEAIGHDDSLRVGASHGWQQHALTYRLRYCEFILLKSKRSGHSTAARIRTLQFRARSAQQGLLIAHFH